MVVFIFLLIFAHIVKTKLFLLLMLIYDTLILPIILLIPLFRNHPQEHTLLPYQLLPVLLLQFHQQFLNIPRCKLIIRLNQLSQILIKLCLLLNTLTIHKC